MSDEQRIIKQKEKERVSQTFRTAKPLTSDQILREQDRELIQGGALKKQKRILSDYLSMDKTAEMQLLEEKEGKRLLLVKERGLVRENAPLERINNKKDRNLYKDTEKRLDREYRDIQGNEDRSYAKEKKQLTDAMNAFDNGIDQCVRKTLKKHPQFLEEAKEKREALLKELLNAFIPEREFTFNPPSSDQKKMAKKFLASFQDDPVKALLKMQSSLQSRRLPKNASRPEYLKTNYRRIHFEMKKRETLSKVFSLAIKDEKYEGERQETEKMGKAAKDVQIMLNSVDVMMETHLKEKQSLLPDDKPDDQVMQQFTAYEEAYQRVRQTEKGANDHYKELVNVAIAKQGRVYRPENLFKEYLDGEKLVRDRNTVIKALKEKKESLSFGETTEKLPVKEAYAYGLLTEELEKSVHAANYIRFRMDALKKVKREPGLPQSFLERSREKNKARLAILENRMKDLCEIAEAIKKGPDALKKLSSRCMHLYTVEFSMPAEDLQRKEGMELLKKELSDVEKDSLHIMKEQAQRQRRQGLEEFKINTGLVIDAESQWSNQLSYRKALVTEQVYEEALQEKRNEWKANDQMTEAHIRYQVSKGEPEGPLLENYYREKTDREKDFRAFFLQSIKTKGDKFEKRIRKDSEAQKKETIQKLLFHDAEETWGKYDEWEKEVFYKQFMDIKEEQDDNVPELLTDTQLINYCPTVVADLRRINELRENKRRERLKKAQEREEQERQEKERKEQERLQAIEKFRPEKDDFLKRTEEKTEEIMNQIDSVSRERGYLLKADLMPLLKQLSTVMAFSDENAVKLDKEGRLQVSALMNEMQSQYDEGLMSLSAQVERFRGDVNEGVSELEKTMTEGTPEDAAEQVEAIQRKAETLIAAYEGQEKYREAEKFREKITNTLKKYSDIIVHIQHQNYRERIEELSKEQKDLSKRKEEAAGGILNRRTEQALLVSDYVERVIAFQITYAGDKDLQYFKKGETLKKADVILSDLKEEAASMEELLFDGNKRRTIEDFIQVNSSYHLKEKENDFRTLMTGYFQRLGRTYLTLTDDGKEAVKDSKRQSLQNYLEMLEGKVPEVEDEKKLLSELANAVVEEEQRKLREQEEERRRLEEKKKEEEHQRQEKERIRQAKQAEEVFSKDNMTVRPKVQLMKEIYENLVKKTNGFRALYSSKSSLEYVKSLQTAPLAKQVLSFTKIGNVVRLEHEEIESTLMSLDRFQDEIEKEAPDLQYNQTDRKELKDYQKVLQDMEHLKKKMKERQNDADQGAVLAFTRYETNRYQSVAEQAMEKIKKQDFSGLDDLRRYMNNVEKIGSMFPGYASNREVSGEYRTLRANLKDQFVQIQGEARIQEEAIKEKRAKEEGEKAQKIKEYEDTMLRYRERFLDIKSKSTELISKKSLTPEELETASEFIDALQQMMVEKEFMDLAPYRDIWYDEFKNQVIYYARDMELIATSARKNNAVSALWLKVSDIQTSNIMSKVHINTYQLKMNQPPVQFSQKEVHELAEVKKQILDIMDSDNYKLLNSTSATDLTIKAFYEKTLDEIAKTNALPGNG